MQVALLGSLQVVADDGEDVTLAGPRLRTLFIVLALRCGEQVPDDALIDAVWGDGAPSRTSNALQRQVSTLRRALGHPELIERRGTGYALALEPHAVDVFRFDALAERGLEALREGDTIRARDVLDDALRLWRGDPLADVTYADFAQPEIARLLQARAVALEARIDADLAIGRDAELISELEQLVVQYPLREHLRAQFMRALARAGRPAEALRAYQDARRVLGEELGVEPSQELRSLELAILREDAGVSRSGANDAFARPKTNLRSPLTRIVGRDSELELLDRQLEEHRLLTLVGPGGVGKSRLALEAGRRAVDASDMEVWIVELAAIDRNDDVIPAILRALELPEVRDGAADNRRLFEYLCTRPALLILDNCEHVVGDVARVVHDLLESCANLRICATSREGLAVPSEVVVPVAPLALDDAVTLFVERARAADRSFPSSDEVAAVRTSVAEVCSRIDRLPLAIELAAARLRAMSITELVAGLDDRFRLLNRGARTALPRQQTLRAVVDWSYDLLFDEERRVFERLSVFRGSCSLAAARVVCADEDISGDDVAELVGRLIEKSLVIAEHDEIDGYTRCHMLQTLVDYGAERLQDRGDAVRLYRAHTAYYTDFAMRSLAALCGVKQRGWLRAVSANLGNLRAAFDVSVRANDAETAGRIAGCLGWYWWFTGRAREGSQWLALAQSCTGPVNELTRARVLAWSAFAHAPGFVGWSDTHRAQAAEDDGSTGHARSDEIDALCRVALDLYARHPEAGEEVAGVELALSVAYSTIGEFGRACDLVSDAERILAATSHTTPAATAMHAFATARRAFLEDNFSLAEHAFRAGAELFAAHGVDAYETFSLRYAARIASLRGDTTAAVHDLDRAIAVARRLGLGGFANMLLADLADAFARAGDVERGRSTLVTLLMSAREVGFRPGIAQALTALALVEWRAGEHDAAEAYARQGVEAADAANYPEAAVYCMTVLGLGAGSLGNRDAARQQLARALDDARYLAAPHRALAFVLRAHAAIGAGDDDVAVARLLGAADALRRAPGRAAGAAFAASAAHPGDMLETLLPPLGSDAVVRAFEAGAADPDAVIAETLASAVS